MVGSYAVTVAVQIGIFAILALSVNILTGFAGQISFGHAAFMGIGAYAAAIATTRYGLSFWVAIPFAALASGLVGMVLGLPSLRIKGDFLAIVSIGINFVVEATFQYSEFFGGALGIGNIPAPQWFGRALNLDGYLVIVWGWVGLTAAITWWLRRSWLGLSFMAVRDDEDAAEIMGLNVPRQKVLAFLISTALAGVGGALFAHFVTFISPDNFGLIQSIEIFSFMALGGIGTVRGPLFGAALLILLPEFSRAIQDYRLLLYGLVLILVMRFQFNGLIGDESWVWTWLVRRREKLTSKLSEAFG